MIEDEVEDARALYGDDTLKRCVICAGTGTVNGCGGAARCNHCIGAGVVDANGEPPA